MATREPTCECLSPWRPQTQKASRSGITCSLCNDAHSTHLLPPTPSLLPVASMMLSEPLPQLPESPSEPRPLFQTFLGSQFQLPSPSDKALSHPTGLLRLWPGLPPGPPWRQAAPHFQDMPCHLWHHKAFSVWHSACLPGQRGTEPPPLWSLQGSTPCLAGPHKESMPLSVGPHPSAKHRAGASRTPVDKDGCRLLGQPLNALGLFGHHRSSPETSPTL